MGTSGTTGRPRFFDSDADVGSRSGSAIPRKDLLKHKAIASWRLDANPAMRGASPLPCFFATLQGERLGERPQWACSAGCDILLTRRSGFGNGLSSGRRRPARLPLSVCFLPPRSVLALVLAPLVRALTTPRSAGPRFVRLRLIANHRSSQFRPTRGQWPSSSLEETGAMKICCTQRQASGDHRRPIRDAAVVRIARRSLPAGPASASPVPMRGVHLCLSMGALVRSADAFRPRGKEDRDLEGLGSAGQPHPLTAGGHRRGRQCNSATASRHDHAGRGIAADQQDLRTQELEGVACGETVQCGKRICGTCAQLKPRPRSPV